MRTNFLTIFLILTAGIAFSFGNNPPNISGIDCRFNGFYETSILYGEKLCFTICTQDADETDSVFLRAENLPFESSFRILNRGDKLETGQFCLNPNKTPNVTDTINFKIIAFSTRDSNPIEVEQEFIVYVHQLSAFRIDISNTAICGNIKIEAERTNDVEINSWTVTIGKFNTSLIKEKNEFTMEVSGLGSGPQRIRVASFDNNGYNNVIDTIITIENGAPFWTNNYDLFQCQAEQVKVDIDDFRRPTATYQWLGFKENERNKSFFRSRDTTYKVAGADGNCLDTLVIEHDVLDLKQQFSKSHKSGSSPLTVEFELEGTSDADSFTVDYGDGTYEHLSVADFPLSKYYYYPNKYETIIFCYKKGIDRCSQTFAFNPIDVYPTSVHENKSELSIYPNPASGSINIATDLKLEKVRIYNNLGQVVYSGVSNSISMDHLPKGTYFLKVSFTDGEELIESVVLE